MPRVHPTAYIDDSAQVIGDVEIGEESSVWMAVVIRGDVHRIRIGRRSNVQDGTVVHVMKDTHATTIGDDVTIGHGAIVHGCTIEDGALIGMGSVLLSGSRIGAGALVAAGAVVLEGFQVPAGQVAAGVPARLRGPVPEELRERLAQGALGYVESAREYRSGRIR